MIETIDTATAESLQNRCRRASRNRGQPAAKKPRRCSIAFQHAARRLAGTMSCNQELAVHSYLRVCSALLLPPQRQLLPPPPPLPLLLLLCCCCCCDYCVAPAAAAAGARKTNSAGKKGRASGHPHRPKKRPPSATPLVSVHPTSLVFGCPRAQPHSEPQNAQALSLCPKLYSSLTLYPPATTVTPTSTPPPATAAIAPPQRVSTTRKNSETFKACCPSRSKPSPGVKVQPAMPN